MNDPKARNRKKTIDEIQKAIAQVQAGQGKVSISSVAKIAGVTPALIHNTYPDLAERSEGWWVGQREPSAIPSMTSWFESARSTAP